MQFSACIPDPADGRVVEKRTNIDLLHILLLLLLLLFLTPVLNSQGMKKLRYAMQKVQNYSLFRQIKASHNTIRRDTIRDAVLTCAQKPTRVSLIYRTNTMNTKTAKVQDINTCLKSKNTEMKFVPAVTFAAFVVLMHYLQFIL